ncbi:hypothetical protein PtrSN002B_001175 [Pyrenophora tritici-repentis]|uniref:Uncharacterized protein n=2 Tax=Pyrenophora tritici-repentis TaxID=45151 RepID=A0A2W1DSS0_9PLEO|nr:uncharacterized protein PTRG_03639 [Pyrenophora tritici-repentis Pt-1C-BFP]KAA8620306.1 hypothetical protein PtrV1_07400 [Pyrenophora tritici-repentis]EDU46477.1 predicted protein [Pyrenophora tritici-repentis Pt-1C-BFP]KAF7448458.1 hypothetical protein A1F99_078220 [Pyrenophora tritici-repentis]KAF7572181.1 hypothetical protein PtrM4_096810 [Pyrenophora tritici-repentis]KAG9384638.1 hypothetical protein A1F94_004185 [Pyrenophora tritici-repentis]
MSKNYTIAESFYAALDHMSSELHTTFQQAIARLPPEIRTNFLLQLVYILGVPLVTTGVVWYLIRVCAQEMRRVDIRRYAWDARYNNGRYRGGHNNYRRNLIMDGRGRIHRALPQLPLQRVVADKYEDEDQVRDEVEEDFKDDMGIDIGADSDADVDFPQSEDSGSEQENGNAAQHDNDSDDQGPCSDDEGLHDNDDNDDRCCAGSRPRRPKPWDKADRDAIRAAEERTLLHIRALVAARDAVGEVAERGKERESHRRAAEDGR